MGKDDIPNFLDSIPDDKLCKWSDSNHSICFDTKFGYRMEHQGLNQDGTHRIVIRTMKGGKSKASKNLSNSAIIARTYVTSPGIPQNVRDALKESAKGLGELVITKA